MLKVAKKITFVLIAAAVIATASVLAYRNTKHFETIVVKQTQQYLLTIAQTQARNIEEVIHHAQDELERLAKNTRLQNRIINNILAEDKLYKDSYSPEQYAFDCLEELATALYRLDAKGIIQNRIPFKENRIGTDYSYKPGVDYVIENHKPCVSKVFMTSSKIKAVSVCQPVFSDRKFIGIVRSIVSLEVIQNLVSHITVGRKGYAWVIDDTMTMIAHPKQEYIGESVLKVRKKAFHNHDYSNIENLLAKMAMGLQGVAVHHSIWCQDKHTQITEKISAFVPIQIGNERWSINVSMDYDEVAKPVEAHAKNLFSGVLLLVLISISVALRMYKFEKKRVNLEAKADSAEKLKSANQKLQAEINERTQAEDALEAMNEELEKIVGKLTSSNLELRDLAYITAHDLKEPLRAIGTLADWIATDYSDKFDEQGKEKLDLLVGRTKRMSNLIDGILQYSIVGRTDGNNENIDVNMAVNIVIEEITPPQNIRIIIKKKLPTISCQRMHMMQIFRRLLDNAVKYMDKPQGIIEVDCVDEDTFWKFSVTDNGPGIEQRYFKKIFQMFQTLSPRDEFESTGMGLAVAKKIVELYDSRIWIESQPTKGSTFFFTFPKQ